MLRMLFTLSNLCKMSSAKEVTGLLMQRDYYNDTKVGFLRIRRKQDLHVHVERC